MYRVNELLGKMAINQASGERIAPVRDVVLNGDVRSIVALIAGTGGLFSAEQVIPWSAIVSLGDVIVVDGASPLGTVKENTEVAGLRKQSFQITGAAVISAAGEKIGTVSDMMADTDGAILGFTVKQGLLANLMGTRFLPIEQVQTVGKDAIITTITELMSLREYTDMGTPVASAPATETPAPETHVPSAPRPLELPSDKA